MRKSFDAAIIGSGAMGSATARHLARQGKKVICFERFGPSHDQGSSHGESRVIRQAYFESPEYVPLAIRSYALWRELEADLNRSLLHITGGLMIGSEQSDVYRGSLKSAQQWDLPHQTLNADQIRKRWPVFQPEDHFHGLFEERAGVLAVEACVLAMSDQARAWGADIRFHCPVLDWRREETFILETEQGRFEADSLVLCPGAWAPELLKMPMPLTVERLVLHWFRPKGPIKPFLPAHFPIHIWQLQECAFYGMAALHGGANGVKTAFHDVKTPCAPATVNREVKPSEIAEMARYIDRYIPSMNHAHLKAKTCMYTTTPDGHFIVGEHPQIPKAFMACGFSGHGFKFAPAIGEALGDLVMHGETQLPLGIFNPRRFDNG